MTIEKINEFLQSSTGNYLEIGVYHGDTFFKIAEANPTHKVYGIDPYISDGWTGQHRGTVLSDAEKTCDEKIKAFSNATIFKMTSDEFLKQLVNPEEMNVVVVFIDGSHWHECVQIDIDLAIKFIGDKKGLILFDDLHIKGVRDAIVEGLSKYPQLQKTECPQVFDMGGIYTVN